MPPIGTVCEQQTWVNREWRIVEVVAHFNKFAVCAWEESPDDNQVELAPPGDLRPIRTPEHIAAEEIEAIFNWMVNRDSERGLRGIAEDLHADGYRKP